MACRAYDGNFYFIQDAKKGILFNDFPPVLQIQLKRFEYNFMRDTMVKVSFRYLRARSFFFFFYLSIL